MNNDELLNLLKISGLPVSYHHFKETPSLPYIVFLRVNDSNINADDIVYFKLKNYQVELYTDIKNEILEEKIETIFDEHEICYETSEEWIESEEMYQIVYEIQI